MTKRRQCYGAQLKLQVGLEAAGGLGTITQIASDHGVERNQVGQLKKQLLEERAAVFTNVTTRWQREQDAQEVELYEQIRRLKPALSLRSDGA